MQTKLTKKDVQMSQNMFVMYNVKKIEAIYKGEHSQGVDYIHEEFTMSYLAFDGGKKQRN